MMGKEWSFSKHLTDEKYQILLVEKTDMVGIKSMNLMVIHELVLSSTKKIIKKITSK
jgi:hypothetical protein